MIKFPKLSASLDLMRSDSLTGERFEAGTRPRYSRLSAPGAQSSTVGRAKVMRFPKIETLFYLLIHFRLGELMGKILGRLHSRTVSYGLRRDLLIPFEAIPPKIPVTIRPLLAKDIPFLLDGREPGTSKKDMAEQAERLTFLRDDIPTCYVAVTQDDKPCYMQWLMSSEDNDRIQLRFNHAFPVLAPYEALVEKAYTPEAYRGLGIMSYAMAHIAKEAERFNAHRVITFVEMNNIPSLKGCKKSGFIPYIIRDDSWFLFRRKLSWKILPEGFLYPFETAGEISPPKERFKPVERTSPQTDNIFTYPGLRNSINNQHVPNIGELS